LRCRFSGFDDHFLGTTESYSRIIWLQPLETTSERASMFE
jgi:hypothetical protein